MSAVRAVSPLPPKFEPSARVDEHSPRLVLSTSRARFLVSVAEARKVVLEIDAYQGAGDGMRFLLTTTQGVVAIPTPEARALALAITATLATVTEGASEGETIALCRCRNWIPTQRIPLLGPFEVGCPTCHGTLVYLDGRYIEFRSPRPVDGEGVTS